MNEQRQDDRFLIDAPLAIRLLGWSWYKDPQWDWVGLWPPDDGRWSRWNFPDKAEPVAELGEDAKLMPSWYVGGYRLSDGPEQMGVPRFSADWRAMAVLVDEMRLRGFWWKGTNFSAADRPALAVFSTRTNVYQERAETMPKATALAALDALTEAGVPGEVSSQTVKGRLTSMRNVALGQPDPFYEQWREAHNVEENTAAALEFIAAWATEGLRAFGEE